MKTKLYASLIGPLLGLYYPCPSSIKSSLAFRVALNSSKLSKLWCSVYTEEEVDEQIAISGGTKLPESYGGKLDYDSYKVQEAESQI